MLTAGLKSPPDTRKKTQTLTASEKPKHRLMYNICAGFGPCARVVLWSPFVVWGVLATWVPAKAKNRNLRCISMPAISTTIWRAYMNVPTNSPIIAIRWFRTALGSLRNNGDGLGACILSFSLVDDVPVSCLLGNLPVRPDKKPLRASILSYVCA